MSLAAAAAAVGGTIDPRFGDLPFERVTIDSRAVRPRDPFVALAGERVDGHDFVAAALAAGAAGAVVGADRAPSIGPRPAIAVRDTRLALAQLARAWRARFAVPLIAVAGSNGKTTVTQMIAS